MAAIIKTETPIEQVVETKTDDQSATNESTATEVENNKIDGEKKDETKNAGTKSNANGGAELQVPKLFVGRLPSGTKENQLKELFSTYGQVTHCDIVGKYGFVHMKDKEEARVAMEKLNNHNFNGSAITVQLSTSTAKKSKRKQNRKKNFGSNRNNQNGNNKQKNNNMNSKNQNNRRIQNNNRYSNGSNQMHNNNRMRNNRNGGRFNRPMRDHSMMPPASMSPMHQYGPPPPHTPINQYHSYPPPPPHHQSPMNYSSYYTQAPPTPEAPMGSGALGNGGHLPPSQMPPSRDMYYDNRQAMGGTGIYNTGPIGSSAQPMYQSPVQNYSQYNQTRNQMKSGIQRGGATGGTPMPPQQPQMYGSPQMAPQVGGYGSYGGGAGAGAMNNQNKYVGYY